MYHWASITAGKKYGRVCGFFAGFWNFFAWIFGAASMSAIVGNCTVQMYAVYHPDFVPEPWHVLVSYLIITWCACFLVMFANKALPAINNVGLFFLLAGVFITILVCAIMPTKTGNGYATNEFVWKSWSADLGYSSNGFIFLMGMLNGRTRPWSSASRLYFDCVSGAFSVGTPDCVSHIAEEIPRPETNVPKAIAAQMGKPPVNRTPFQNL